jgi:hypothetical protein
VKAVEADLRLGKVLGGARLKSTAHVHAQIGNRARLAAMLGEIAGELPQRGLVSTGRGKQQTWRIKIMENSDVRLAALTGGLIHADGTNLGMTLLGARLRHMMLDDAPQSGTANAQHPARRQYRHGRRQHQRQGLEQQREATPFARPGHREFASPCRSRHRRLAVPRHADELRTGRNPYGARSAPSGHAAAAPPLHRRDRHDWRRQTSPGSRSVRPPV